jgi:membrane fusion protein (multidrug efflux system)
VIRSGVLSLSEQEYLAIAPRINERGHGGHGAKAYLGGGADAGISDGSTYPYTERFAADREIDPKTGTIRISATFPNPDRTLRPGQYGRVRAETSTKKDALLVPQRSVRELQGAFQLRVVGDDDRVATRTVKVGERVGSRWVVTDGLAPGARVVVEGAPTRDGDVVRAPVAAAEGH